MKKITILLTLIITVSLFGGCKNTTNNNQPNTQKGSIYDPCELLTAEDLQKYFPNKTAKITQHETKANIIGQKICFYSFSDEELIYAQLSVVNQAEVSSKANQNIEKLFNDMKTMYENIIEIENIGASAYFGQTSIFPAPEITVLAPSKTVYFNIDLNLGDTNKDEERYHKAEKELAELVLSRL